jgi:hypothetical protein
MTGGCQHTTSVNPGGPGECQCGYVGTPRDHAQEHGIRPDDVPFGVDYCGDNCGDDCWACQMATKLREEWGQ